MSTEKHIRRLEPRDRSRIEEMLVSSGKFTAIEIDVALELVDAALEEGDESGYIVVMVEEGKANRKTYGYACYGPIPLTQGAYDLYWIVVDPAAQGKGLGGYLLKYVERDVLKLGGRLLLIDTSSQESYSGTIHFYESKGFQLAARIKNFYRIGDDKLIFSKELI